MAGIVCRRRLATDALPAGTRGAESESALRFGGLLKKCARATEESGFGSATRSSSLVRRLRRGRGQQSGDGARRAAAASESRRRRERSPRAAAPQDERRDSRVRLAQPAVVQ